MTKKAEIKVYFDGSCPVCRAEIEELDRADSDGKLEFLDCSQPEVAESSGNDTSPAQAEMLNALHIQADGKWISGPDAFAEIYQSVNLTRLARLWGSARLRPVVNLIYRLFVITRPLLAWLGTAGAVRWFVRREVQRSRKRQ